MLNRFIAKLRHKLYHFGIVPYVVLLIVIAFLCLAYAYVVEPRRLVVRRYRVRFSADRRRLDVSKAEGEGTRIVFFSDLHAGPWFKDKDIDRVGERIKGLSPDLILFAGDLVTEQSEITSPAFKQSLIDQFKKLSQIAPVVAVPGNHDVEDIENDGLTKAIYEEAGVTLLQNDIYKNEAEAETFPLIYGSEEGLWGSPMPPPKGFSGLMLCHQPDLVPGLISDSQAVLSLSGHTHRGQVTFFGLPIVKVPLGKKYTYGHYVFNEGQALLVSSGVGMVHLPFRFGAPPELLLLTIEEGE